MNEGPLCVGFVALVLLGDFSSCTVNTAMSLIL